MITTQMALGEWEKVSEYLGQIRYLHASIDADDTEILLSSIQDQINWLYKRIAIDERKEQVRHFFEVRELYEDIEDIVEASYGDDSLEAIPWLYKIAYNDYHLVRFLNASDGVGFDAVDRLVRQEGGFYLDTYNRNTSFFNNSSTILIVEEGKPIGEAYLRASSALVNKIEDIVIEKSDLEAQAMAKIYRADYLRIADRGSAIGSYREAAKMLQEAGIPEQDLRWFFERPMVIPVQTYHMRFADMLKELKQRSAAIESVPAEVIHLGVFTAWTEALDSTPMPENDPPFWQSENAFQYVDLSFDVSSRGIASSVDILATSKEESTSKGRIWRSMRDIDFRPAIIDNKMRRVKDVQLRYQFVDK
jgi:hypothetical protein